MREYVELGAEGETVTHLEKLKTEYVTGRKIDAWDVWTDKDRYWVITDPTNLYLQSEFKSLDYAISFHVGVTLRVFSQNPKTAPSAESLLLLAALRQLDDAAAALEKADEAEQFQAIGARCRECLVSLAHWLAASTLAEVPKPAPRRSDFSGWMEILAGTCQQERLRSYLQSSAVAAWSLVNWLTHEKNAVRFDAEIAMDATSHIVHMAASAFRRWEAGVPEKCPSCNSYRLIADYRADLDRYVTLCEACGWNEKAPKSRQRKRRNHA